MGGIVQTYHQTSIFECDNLAWFTDDTVRVVGVLFYRLVDNCTIFSFVLAGVSSLVVSDARMPLAGSEVALLSTKR